MFHQDITAPVLTTPDSDGTILRTQLTLLTSSDIDVAYKVTITYSRRLSVSGDGKEAYGVRQNKCLWKRLSYSEQLLHDKKLRPCYRHDS